MKINDKEVERRMKRFEQVCRDAGIKLTHQRIEIFRELAQTGEHPDAEAICRGVSERIPTVSLDTVYRTLWLASDLGLITKLGPPRERARFDANLSRHHHFVCIRCGFIRDFYSDQFSELNLPESMNAYGQVKSTHVEARGVCLECTKKEKQKLKNSKKEKKS